MQRTRLRRLMPLIVLLCYSAGFAPDLLPNSEALHIATEKSSPDGLYGKWFSPIMIGICALWLVGTWLPDREPPS